MKKIKKPTKLFSDQFIKYVGIKSYITASLSMIFFGMLHWLSPEFNPASRMVSEYALGNHSFLTSLMFASMATSCAVLSFGLMAYVSTILEKCGVFLLGAAAVGLYMAAVFGLPHSLHGLSALIGIPSLTLSIIILSFSLVKQKTWAPLRTAILLVGNLTWISLVAMFAFIFMSISPSSAQFNAAEMVGWANRSLMLCYAIWLLLISLPLFYKKASK